MTLGVEIISTEQIKPSSPTSSHLRTFKLSLLDQLIPAPYAPVILFYPDKYATANHGNVRKKINSLKQSLSETLTRFYPLAGKIKDDLSIECDDGGAYLVEAHVNCCLPEFLYQPDLLLLSKFLPSEPGFRESISGTYVTNIQVNAFNCGGIAIGLRISHRILDGAALGTFLKAWATRTRGSRQELNPSFIAPSLFLAYDLWLKDSSMVMWGSMFKKGRSVTRRFLFDSSAIAALKAQISTSSPSVQDPTRVEVVSALFWKCFMAGTPRPSMVSHLVNLRRRMDKELCSEYAIGNLVWLAAAECGASHVHEAGLDGRVGLLKSSISKIDNDFVEKLQSDEGHAMMKACLKAIGPKDPNEEVEHFGFSSWCNLGFYEVDFGWGNPAWVSSIGSSDSVFMNLTILFDTRLGGGIEAWVTLDEHDMAKLEGNPELLTYASLDPSPLTIGNSMANS